MIFYEKPVALNRDRHRDLKLATATGDFSFARNTNSLLIAATELPEAILNYPAVFVGKPGGPFTLAVMVGLSDQENLFMGADGYWSPDSYIPAFVRRYPFVLAEGEQADGDLTVCVDEAFAGINTEQGESLFGADGKESTMLQGAIDFLRLFHVEMQNTHAFAQRLADLDLLAAKTIEVERAGRKQLIDGIFIVDVDKLLALDDAALLRLVRSGDMQLIDAHLLSLKQIPRLASRIDSRAREALPNAAGAAAATAAGT